MLMLELPMQALHCGSRRIHYLEDGALQLWQVQKREMLLL